MERGVWPDTSSPHAHPVGYAYSFQIAAWFWGVILLKTPDSSEHILEAGPKMCSISDDTSGESHTDVSRQLLIQHSVPQTKLTPGPLRNEVTNWSVLSPLLLWPDYVAGDYLCDNTVAVSSQVQIEARSWEQSRLFMIIKHHSQLLKVSSNVQCQTHRILQIISAESCCSVTESSQQDKVFLDCVTCLTPRKVSAALPRPILHHEVEDGEDFFPRLWVFSPRKLWICFVGSQTPCIAECYLKNKIKKPQWLYSIKAFNSDDGSGWYLEII